MLYWRCCCCITVFIVGAFWPALAVVGNMLLRLAAVDCGCIVAFEYESYVASLIVFGCVCWIDVCAGVDNVFDEI